MILVTGANGFLGEYLCKGLLQSGYQVRAMVRMRDSFLLTGCEVMEADLTDPSSLEDVLEGVDRVIHCAASISFSRKDCDHLLKVNAHGTRNLVNLCQKYEIDHFIYISSTAAIGRNKREETLDEDAMWLPSSWNTCYGRSKHLAEMEVWRAGMEGMPMVILNPSVILGYQKIKTGSGKLIDYVEKEHRFYPSGEINYVDVRDVVKITLEVLKQRITGERYILCAGSVSYKDFFYQLAGLMHKTPPSIAAGKLAKKFVYWGEQVRIAFTGKQPFITRETLRQSGSRIKFDNHKVRQQLNFTFAPLSETLKWISGS